LNIPRSTATTRVFGRRVSRECRINDETIHVCPEVELEHIFAPANNRVTPNANENSLWI
jgi:hypothetical protein